MATTIELANQLTLLELSKGLDPDGSVATIAEILTEENPILEDASFFKANKKNGFQVTRRTKLPRGQRRKYNQGVGQDASQKRQIIEQGGMVEVYSTIDKALAQHLGGAERIRQTEDTAFLEGMGQDLAYDIFYANPDGDPDDMVGLAPRLTEIDEVNVWDNSGGAASVTENKTSIYIVQWGERSCHMFYPENDENFGIVHTDLGEVTAQDPNDSSKMFQAYRSHFQFHGGLAVHNPKSIKRICNISTTNVDGVDDFGFDEDFLIAALNELPKGGKGAVIYVNGKLMTQLQIRAKDKSNVHYDGKNPWGMRQLHFLDFPIKKCDQISSTESKITAV